MNLDGIYLLIIIGSLLLVSIVMCAWGLHLAYWKGHDDGLRAGKAIEDAKWRRAKAV